MGAGRRVRKGRHSGLGKNADRGLPLQPLATHPEACSLPCPGDSVGGFSQHLTRFVAEK